MPQIRITCPVVFGATLVVVWICLAWFGDFNTYMDLPNGQRMIVEEADFEWGVVFSSFFAIPIAVCTTLAFWIGRLLWITLRKR